jgi:hypothetical protein
MDGVLPFESCCKKKVDQHIINIASFRFDGDSDVVRPILNTTAALAGDMPLIRTNAVLRAFIAASDASSIL